MAENTDRETASRARRALILIGASIVLAVALILVFGGTALAPTPSGPAPTSRPSSAPSLTFSAGPAGYLAVLVSDPPDGAIEVTAACVTGAGASFEVAAAAARDAGMAQASLHLGDAPLTCTVTASADAGGKPVVFASAVFERN
jgi:hypothetical protein